MQQFDKIEEVRQHNRVEHRRGQNTPTKDQNTQQKEGANENRKSTENKGNTVFCHYFNNKKSCPFTTRCKFRPTESPQCHNGSLCDRPKCMFKHDDLNKKNQVKENPNDKDRKDGKQEDTNNLLDSKQSQTETNHIDEST